MSGENKTRFGGIVFRLKGFLFLMMSVALLMGCNNKVSSVDLDTLKSINSKMNQVSQLNSKLHKESLSRKELKKMAPDADLRLENPQPIKEIIDNRFLDLGNDFFSQLESSQINRMGGGTRQEQKLFKMQNLLRYQTYSLLMKKIYTMNDRQTEYYYTWIKNLSPEGLVQMNYMNNMGNLSYYKNVPELTGGTMDTDATNFFTVKIHLGYELGNKKTQTILNQNKHAMSDIIRNYFSSQHLVDLSSENEPLIKAQLRILLNRQVLKYDKTGDLDGIENVTIVGLQTYQL